MSFTERTSETRPWGNFVTLEDAPSHKLKRITVLPGARLSYQLHDRRAEHWYIISGSGIVTLNGNEHAVKSGDAIDVAFRTPHRIENTGTNDLVFIEVQTGEYFGEDDIVRLADDYGRAGDSENP